MQRTVGAVTNVKMKHDHELIVHSPLELIAGVLGMLLSSLTSRLK